MRFIAAVLIFCFWAQGEVIGLEASPSPEQALQRLKSGNKRFVGGKTECVQGLLKELELSQEKQTPYAAILSCSDSRVPTEFLFGETLGKLFVIRVAGNVATDVTIGSIEYAVEYLKVPLVLVLGHESCGVLDAALKGNNQGPPFVNDLLNHVSSSVFDANRNCEPFSKELLDTAIKKNVKEQMRDLIGKSRLLEEAVRKKRVRVQGAVFNFQSGEVEWLP